jgi:hypothetical protein
MQDGLSYLKLNWEMLRASAFHPPYGKGFIMPIEVI